MVSLPKIIGVLSCGVVLCLSLADASQAFRLDPCASRKGSLPNLVGCSKEAQQGIQTIKGEVLRAEGDTLVVQRFNGQEVELPIAAVRNGQVFQPGDWIEAKVNREKHVMAIHDINNKEHRIPGLLNTEETSGAPTFRDMMKCRPELAFNSRLHTLISRCANPPNQSKRTSFLMGPRF